MNDRRLLGACEYSSLALALVILTSGCAEGPVKKTTDLDSYFSVKSDTGRPRNAVLPPLVSSILPGFDQWWEGQYFPAFLYTGAATGGITLAATVNPTSSPTYVEPSLTSKNDRARFQILGVQIYSAAGGLSAYHSFRTAVRTRLNEGEYDFLTAEESIGDLMKAPFTFEYFLRPTTFIPLLTLTAAIGIFSALDGYHLTSPDHSDVGFAGAFSYNAGVWEEAFFRGYMLPVAVEHTRGWQWFGNTITAAIFALAHYSEANRLPWPQFIAGFYFGWLTERNHYRISESIFVHSWWDIVAFLAEYSLSKNTTTPYTVRLPVLQVRF